MSSQVNLVTLYQDRVQFSSQVKDKKESIRIKITQIENDKSISVKITGLAVASHFHMEDKRANNEGGEKTATERCIWPLWWC